MKITWILILVPLIAGAFIAPSSRLAIEVEADDCGDAANPCLFLPMIAVSGLYYVAPNGSDSSGDGSAGRPWRTITHAAKTVADGAIINVKPGTYNGQVDLRRSFSKGITIQSEIPYQARLRHDGQVVICFFCQGVTLEGFDISHSGPGADRYLIQIQDSRDDGSGGKRVTLRNNIIHDSYNNDLLKINNGADQITVEGNIFYNQSGLDDHIDLTSATNITIQDNILFNDFSGSGRPNNNDTGSFIVVKDVDGSADGNLGSRYITIRRNVFLNWSGNSGNAFVTLGDNSARNYYHARDVLIENNLMLGNADNVIHAVLKVVGSRDIVFSHNTVVGDLPAKSFAFRLTTGNLNNINVQFFNNIWSDPSETMGAEYPGDTNRFSRTEATDSFALENNLYWNGGEAIPADASEPINYTADGQAIIADPLLKEDQSGLVAPRWKRSSGLFADGSKTIREAFERLVTKYGALPSGSPAINAADPAYSSTEDILGKTRTGSPDIGAYER